MVRITPILLLLACGGEEEPAECRTGFETGSDGLCYETVASTTGDTGATITGDEDPIRAFLESLEPCTLPAGDGTLDLDGGCADGMCVGMTYDQMTAAYGSDATCELIEVTFGAYGTFRYLDCTWANGVSSNFDDNDGDGIPDPTATAYVVYVDPPFDGTTSDGLGLNVPMDCFVPVLGMPASVDFDREMASDFTITTLHYEVPYIYVDDYYGDAPLYAPTPNGEADGFSLYGGLFIR